MKILTFGDYNYIPHTINSYRNLKEFNRHNDITILSTDQQTVDKIKSIEPDCDIRVYNSKRFYISKYSSDNLAHYCILQFIKQEIIQEFVEIHGKVFYLDSDVIVFKDFFDIIDDILNTNDFALKFYLQSDRFNANSIRNIVNCGTIGVKKSDNSDKMFNYFFDKTLTLPPKGNLDEYYITDFFDSNQIKYHIIDDNINLINNEHWSYRIEEIQQISPMSFHPTYTINEFYPNRPYTKVGVAKALNKWFYD